MRRTGVSLLFAYAVAATVVVAWFGCRILVYHRLIAGMMGSRTQREANEISFEQILSSRGVTAALADPAEAGALIVASINLPQIAAIACFVFAGCFAFPLLRRPRGPVPASPAAKD